MRSPEFPNVLMSEKGKEKPSQSLYLLDWALLTITSSRTVRNELPMIDLRLDGARTKLVPGQLCSN
jgi:hypothetical protein